MWSIRANRTKNQKAFNMTTRFHWLLLLLACIISVAIHAQNDQFGSLNIGDPAPPLKVSLWIKGEPIQRFEKGRIYVVEFWATWCKPCIAAMPDLSVLASEYKDRVTFLGIDIYERKTTCIEKIRSFVDSAGQRMDYNVAADNNNLMVTGWMDASGEKAMGIPRTFVVNAEGSLAWIGHPKDLAEVLHKMVNNDWDIKEALFKRNLDKHLRELDDSISFELINYSGNAYKQDYVGKPDSALLLVNKIVKDEPKLKYAPHIAFYTFSSLLKINQHKAYEYGKATMATQTYEEPAYDAIIRAIEVYSDKLSLTPKIYQLGAEGYQAQIDQIPYPDIANIYKLYDKMANWYWRANDKSKAINAQQKALEALKSKKDFSKADLVAFKSRLQQYKNNLVYKLP